MRLGKGQVAVGGAADIAAISQPLVADAAQTINIGQAVACCERLALGGCTGDADAASGQVINVSHRELERTANRRANSVGGSDLQVDFTRICVTWSPRERAGICVELKPAW